MKKTVKYLAAAFLAGAVMLSGCSKPEPPAQSGELRVITVNFPPYDFVKQITGGSVVPEMLLKGGQDAHTFEPTAKDIIKINEADIFIYTGGESDAWVDTIADSIDSGVRIVRMSDLVDLIEEDHDDDEHEHEHDDDHDHEEETEYDEHIWLSLRNSAALSGEIASGLEALTGESYSEELEAYTSALRELDDKYTAAVNGGKVKTVLFGDRFPFRYLTDDYGLSYYAAFAGCSAETEASFETVIFLADKVDELGIRAVLTIESSDGRIAETIIENTASKNAKVLRLDSMQSTTSKDIEAGASYVGIMEKNLEVLKEALG